jgi:flagellar protein FlbT
VRRLCYSTQLVLSGDAKAEALGPQLLRRIEELSQILTDHDSRRQLAEATNAILDGQYYQCLRALRRLIPREDRLLANHA